MSIKVPKSDIEIIPSGNYMARCYSMIHIGNIPNDYAGETRIQNKVLITWELPTLTYEHEEKEYSSIIFKEFTLTMGTKGNLRTMLESWRGKAFTEAEAEDFDLTKLLGAPCMVNIIHKISGKGSTYAYISSVTRIPKGLECPAAVREQFEFNYEDNFSVDAIDNMPEFIRNKVKLSQEYLVKMAEQSNHQVETVPVQGTYIPPPEDSADDLPF